MGIAPYAKRVEKLSGSAVREILKLTQQPNMISFAGGMPSDDAFPTEDLKKIMTKIIDNLGSEVLQYGVTEGYLPLKEEIVNMMAPKGIVAKAENILVTSGSQQGIDLVAKAFLDQGDKVIVESPTYLSAIQAFKLYEGELIAAPVDEEGIIPGALQEILDQEGNRVKILYMIPTFQNPTGKTVSLARRQAILAVAAQYDLLVIEDDPYGDLRYSGEPVAPMKTLDSVGQVLYLGSFSKIIAPGLRVGYAIGNDEILRKMVIGKQANDVHTPVFSQMVVTEYLKGGFLPEHLLTINAQYQEKRDLMLQTLTETMPQGVSWTHPEGGLFIWLTLPAHLKSGELLLKAIGENVAFVAGDSFFAHGEPLNAMRLNFSNASLDNIVVGISKLAKVIKENM